MLSSTISTGISTTGFQTAQRPLMLFKTPRSYRYRWRLLATPSTSCCTTSAVCHSVVTPSSWFVVAAVNAAVETPRSAMCAIPRRQRRSLTSQHAIGRSSSWSQRVIRSSDAICKSHAHSRPTDAELGKQKWADACFVNIQKLIAYTIGQWELFQAAISNSTDAPETSRRIYDSVMRWASQTVSASTMVLYFCAA